jgi:copper(I)-binding protein
MVSRGWVQRIGTAWALALAGGLLAACAAAPGGPTSDLQIEVVAAPGGAKTQALSVTVSDADGAPVTDAQVSLEGNMNHAGMAPVLVAPVSDDADGTADGLYVLPFEFTMLGDWIMTVTVEWAGTKSSRELPLAVSAAGVKAGDQPIDQLRILAARAKPAPLAGGTGGVFLTVVNGTAQDDRIIGGSSPAAALVEIHQTIDDNGIMRMRQLADGLAIPAGGRVMLQPGGLHIMLMNLAAPLREGDTVALTLVFEQAGERTLQVPVVGMDAAAPAMEHGAMEEGELEHSPEHMPEGTATPAAEGAHSGHG